MLSWVLACFKCFFSFIINFKRSFDKILIPEVKGKLREKMSLFGTHKINWKDHYLIYETLPISWRDVIYILPYFLIFSCLLVSTILYFAVYLLVLSSLLRLIRTNTKRRKKVSKKWASLYIKWSIHVLCTLLLTLKKSFNNQSPALKLWWTNGKSRIL